MVTGALARVGWIGLGKMGLPMARRLLDAGHPLSAYNRSPAAARTLAALGARTVASARELRDADAVVTMVADDDALHAVCMGTQGCYLDLRPGALHIDMSTVSPRVSLELAAAARARGIRYLRAPVSGSTAAAAGGSLTILVSGEHGALAAARPLLEKLGKTIHHVGADEQARYLKLALNLMVGVTAAMFGEAVTLASKGDVDWRQAIDVMKDSAIGSPLVGYKARMVAERRFDAMFSVSQMGKDLDLALEAARACRVPTPVLALVRQGYLALQADGGGELDFFSYVTLIERLAGVREVQSAGASR